MDIHLMHTITGVAIVLAFAGKIVLHYYLDYTNDRRFGISGLILTPGIYFKFYKGELSEEQTWLKGICNLLLLLFYISLILNFIFGVLIYYR
jgi:hypothetical protein